MPKSKPTDDKIREKAYNLWEKDGQPEGRDQDYWLKAETELSKPARKAPAKKPAAKKAPAKAAAKPRAKAAKPKSK